jgi:HD-GYP domain-containing protein (c-di-GMP phosphodiesterase class II)
MPPDALMDAWSGVALRAGAMLRDAASPDLESRIHRIEGQVRELTACEPDGSLLWLVHHNASEPHNYSVLHALLVAVVCDLAADCLGGVSAEMRLSMRRAALTMNLCITRLQDELTQQPSLLTTEQREAIQGHGARAAARLRDSGVIDALWLEAVEHHHDAPAGALSALPPGVQLARLIQQADIFAARLSPRRARKALAANDAAKGVYFDERKAPDEAGAAVIKAVGMYLPGSYVRLRNGDVAVVVRRGELANQPVVASVATAQGMPFSHPQRRDARLPEHAVSAGLPPHEMRVRVTLAQLLRLSK